MNQVPTHSAQPILQCSNLDVKIGQRTLASSVHFQVMQGETHAIMGPSGAGKSTLLWTLLGLMPNSSGEIYINGERIKGGRREACAKTRRKHVGIIYQQANLINDLTVIENVTIPYILTQNIDKASAESHASELLASFGIDTSTPTSYLSGGEQQRVAIARAAIHKPAIIVADEPTASLDKDNATLVMETLRQYCEVQNTALLMVTHDERAARYASHHWLFSDGSLTSN